MNNVHLILPVIALILAVGAIVRPAWPLLAVSVILLAVAMPVG
jgi:hypothetical protein